MLNMIVIETSQEIPLTWYRTVRAEYHGATVCFDLAYNGEDYGYDLSINHIEFDGDEDRDVANLIADELYDLTQAGLYELDKLTLPQEVTS